MTKSEHWIDHKADALVRAHVCGRGWVVCDDLGELQAREPDYLTGGTRLAFFDEWSAAYIAALKLLEKA